MAILPDPPDGHVLPDNRAEFPLEPDPARPSIARMLLFPLAVLLATAPIVAGLVGVGVLRIARDEPAPLTPVEQVLRLQREAVGRNCVLFMVTQGSADARAARSASRMLSAYAESEGVADPSMRPRPCGRGNGAPHSTWSEAS